jgi:hypothetical protein
MDVVHAFWMLSWCHPLAAQLHNHAGLLQPRYILLPLHVNYPAAPQACCLVRLDLSQSAWQLSSSNRSISVTARLPAHVLGVLAAAGVVQQDPLYR